MASVSPEVTSKPNRLALIVNLGLVYLIWGSTYFAIRVAVQKMPPLLMSGVRFLIAGSLLYVTLRILRVPRPTMRQWVQAGIVGVLLLGAGNGTVSWVEQWVPSSIAALLVALVPLWMVTLNWVLPGGARPSLRTLVGVALGFGGVALLAFRGGGAGGGVSPMAFLLVISSFAWAAGSLYARKADMPASPLMSTAVEMLVGSVTLLAVGLGTGEASKAHLDLITWQSLVALGFLILFGSLVGYSAYTWLLKEAPPALISTYAYVNPVVALFLGVTFGGDTLTSISLIAAAIIIASVVLISLPGSAARARMRARRASQPNLAPSPIVETVGAGERG